eukprot:7310743-Prymnesium_polylepis.1
MGTGVGRGTDNDLLNRGSWSANGVQHPPPSHDGLHADAPDTDGVSGSVGVANSLRVRSRSCASFSFRIAAASSMGVGGGKTLPTLDFRFRSSRDEEALDGSTDMADGLDSPPERTGVHSKMDENPALPV